MCVCERGIDKASSLLRNRRLGAGPVHQFDLKQHTCGEIAVYGMGGMTVVITNFWRSDPGVVTTNSLPLHNGMHRARPVQTAHQNRRLGGGPRCRWISGARIPRSLGSVGVRIDCQMCEIERERVSGKASRWLTVKSDGKASRLLCTVKHRDCCEIVVCGLAGTLTNVQRFRGVLVCKAHRLVYHSTLGLRVVKKKKVGGKNRGVGGFLAL